MRFRPAGRAARWRATEPLVLLATAGSVFSAGLDGVAFVHAVADREAAGLA